MREFWKYLPISPVFACNILFFSGSVYAGEIPATSVIENQETQSQNLRTGEVIAQTTSVSQLSDVRPTDWAFQALRSLIERYGCISGYPDNTFRGNRTLTRYEFAAALNACLDRVNQLIAEATTNVITQQDILRLQRLQEEFSAEIATLRGRVDTLEARTSQLEANQFSTTTKLQGEVVAVMSGVLSDDQSITQKNTTLGLRSRIEFVTSFTGKDTLFTRIAANNLLSPDISTPEGSLAFAGDSGTTNAEIDAVFYKFPLSANTQVIAIANNGAADDITDTVNIFDGDGSSGALSTFGTRNPIYNQLGGAGLGITQKFGERLALNLGYLTSTPNDPSDGSGLFNGPYAGLAQLTLTPSDRISLGLTYINSYRQPLVSGSTNATFQNIAPDTRFSSNSYGVQASIGISERFVLGGWAGYTNSQLTGNPGKAEIWNYAVTLGFPDLGKRGNLAGIIAGVEPKVTSSTIPGVDTDTNTSYHLEAFYQYQLSDNITITPGLIWLTSPNHNNNNNDVVIGALRTRFSF
ncbi:iron uptake porin [Anabaenopsis elenkinii]|uniref:Iron uptake porin n=1 Tax=Anabaenopsis elenkinii CCIBt3563 TaxID=2779889 RepID=A0A7S6RH44_9CYAN|nr:iron uptake porin [Anabaenopsis elenkinii]QOV24753.1 iron uptake porin [Anabaenopsis elenkinii CCIBt3563]